MPVQPIVRSNSERGEATIAEVTLTIAMLTHAALTCRVESKLRRVKCALSLCYSMSAHETLHRVHGEQQTCCKLKSARAGSISGRTAVMAIVLGASALRVQRGSGAIGFSEQAYSLCRRFRRRRSIRHHLAGDRRQDGRRTRTAGRGRKPNRRGRHRRDRLCGAIGARRLHNTEHDNGQSQQRVAFEDLAGAVWQGPRRGRNACRYRQHPRRTSVARREEAGRFHRARKEARTCSTRPPVSVRRRT